MGEVKHSKKSEEQEKNDAVNRLTQVSEHLDPKQDKPASSRRRRREPNNADELPADHSDVLGYLKTLRSIAANPDITKRGYVKQKQAGKLWVRERVKELLDPGSFMEVGSVSGTVKWKHLGGVKEEPEDYVASNNVSGFGRVISRDVLVTADDFSIRAGHADGAMMAKTIYLEKLALAMKLPMIKLVDGSSGGGSVSSIKTMGFSYIPPLEAMEYVVKQLNAGIPNIGAILGPAIGYGAARVTLCHFTVMCADVGSLFNAGPKVVAGATFEEGLSFSELGGATMHTTNGTADNLAVNELDCFAQIRRVLSYLPNSGTQLPPRASCTDPTGRESPMLRSIIPRKRERMYDARKVITEVVDQDSWFEIGTYWGRTVIVGLARMDGAPVGIVSNNCEVQAGALDAQGSQKLARHLKFLDMFNIPLVQFVDVPGYSVGLAAERSATMRWGVELAKVYYTTTMPIFSVITRRAYGVAGGVMLDCRNPRTRIAWPSGEWGSLPLDGGIEAGHSAELREVEKAGGLDARKARYKVLEEEYRRLMNPIRTANAFGVSEIVDPAKTRRLLCQWANHMYSSLLPERVAERIAGKLTPVFA